jgi:DNA polymerase-3 subunit delta
MNHSVATIKSQLSKDLKGLYLVHGDEPLQLMETCDLIRAQAQKQGFAEREIYEIDKSFDWAELFASTHSMSLFSQRRVIEIRVGNGKLGDKGGKALTELINDPPVDTLFLIIAAKLDKPTQRTKWFSAVSKHGVTVPIWPIEPRHLPAWIKTRMEGMSLRPDRDAIQMMAECGEGNLLAISQEIEKLSLLKPASTIVAQDIAELVSDNARFDIYGLVDACLAGENQRIVRMLAGLKAEGVETILLLWALTREIRSMVIMARHMEQGSSVDQVMSTARVWSKRKNMVGDGLRRNAALIWEQFLVEAGQIDQSIKGMSSGKVWDELLQLCLKIAGVRLFKPVGQVF